MNIKILTSLIVMGLVASTIGMGTIAYFNDIEASTGNTISAGTLDLKVWDGQAFVDDPTVALVTLEDLKPSQPHYVTKWIRVTDNPAKVYMHITDIDCGQGIQSEPEEKEEFQYPDRALWTIDDYTTYDLTIDGEVIIHDGEHIKLGYLESKWIYLGTFEPGKEIKIVQSFHLQAEVTNWAQGDTCTFTEEFQALQTNAPDPENSFNKIVLLENKDHNTWQPILGDGIYGVLTYHTSSLTGTLNLHGLTPNNWYYMKLWRADPDYKADPTFISWLGLWGYKNWWDTVIVKTDLSGNAAVPMPYTSGLPDPYVFNTPLTGNAGTYSEIRVNVNDVGNVGGYPDISKLLSGGTEVLYEMEQLNFVI